jgi:SAM-dependent methyltransferase
VSEEHGGQAESSPSRAELWDERHASGDPIESSNADPTLIEEVGVMTPGVALDVGAGDGRNAIWLAEHGWRVMAVDFSTVALDRGRTTAATAGVEVEWRLADLLEWAPPVGTFDLVCLFFIHLPSDERQLVYARAAAAVARGGTLLVVGHDRSNLTDGVGGPRDPGVLFTPDEIVSDLPAGFVVERAVTVRRATSAALSPLDAVVRATRL